jgi:hypothetical protein
VKEELRPVCMQQEHKVHYETSSLKHDAELNWILHKDLIRGLVGRCERPPRHGKPTLSSLKKLNYCSWYTKMHTAADTSHICVCATSAAVY